MSDNIKYWAIFSSVGTPMGYFPSDIHPEPPVGAVEITEAQYQELISHPGLRRYVDGQVVVYAPPAPPPVIPALTRRQLRLGLLANGITTAHVEAVIAAIPNELAREMAQIEWADASQYERDHPLVDQIGTVMDLTSEQIDAMWAAAVAL